MTTKTTATVFDKMFEEMERIDFYERQADELMNELEEMSQQVPTDNLTDQQRQYLYKLNMWGEAHEQLSIYFKRLAKVE